jgi:hypothetical protein
MNRMSHLWHVVAIATLVTGIPSTLQPQGLAGAAVVGVVTRRPGEPIPQTRVVLRNASTGFTREQRAGSNGRFVFEGVPPGGPYELRAFALGLEPARPAHTFTLALGDRVAIDLAFSDQATAVLPTVAVRSDPRGDEGGPSFALRSELVHDLPLLNRDFTGLFATIPQAVNVRGEYSVSGQLPSLNAIQIDGGIANDVYGVSRTPGENAGAKSISLEAIDQIQVLVAPLDVRQGSFTGALINGITRSGTNRWQASMFTSVQDQILVGKDTAGTRADGFDVLQYGATIGGPIIRDRLHLFVAADLQRKRTPFIGPDVSDPATGITVATATRASAAFRTVYGFDAGGPEPPVLNQPDRSVFAKLTWQPSSRHHVELSHNWVDAWDENLTRNPRLQSLRPVGWQLSRSGMVTSDVIHTTRLHATSAFGSLGNEIIAGVQTTNEDHASTLSTPLFLVQGDSAGSYLAGGSVGNATGTILDQRMTELTDDVTLPLGSHELTAGAHAEWYRFTDNFFPSSWGIWRFPSVEKFEQRQPDSYQVALPLRPGGPLGDFTAGQVAAYVQDRWTPVERLSVTAGVRADRPHSDVPAENPALASSAALGAGYSRRFAAATQISPRLGLSWRANDRHAVVVRAGAGMFAARAPQVWLGNEFTNTGLDQATLVCTTKEGVPAPVIDVGSLPSQCTKSGSTTPIRTAAYIARDFRAPQVWKSLVGIDAVLAWETSVSIDVVRTDARYQMYVRDANLTPTGTNAEGRAMYGSPGATGSLTPSRPEPALGQVLAYDSQGGDHSMAVSVSVTKRWSNGSIAQAGYQWSRAVDALTLFNPGPALMFQNSALDGTIDARRQTRSGTDVPHRLVASAVARLPFAAQASFLLRAQSGRPYAYTMSGDANADGVSLNDLFYVPRDSVDISLTNPERWGDLDRYVESHACLRAQRGRIMARNSCRNPAVLTLDGRLAKTVSLGGIQRMEIGVDVFNLPNLLSRDWGLVRETASNQSVAMLGVSGWDPVLDRPQYRFLPGGLPADNVALVDASRWKVQLGIRYWLR